MDPVSVSVIGAVGENVDPKSPTVPPEKKSKKDKALVKAKKPVDSTSTDSKISELDLKWSECFNILEALIMSKSFQPTFSSDVRVTPPRSPPANVSKDSEPFFQPTHRSVDTSVKRTGPDSHAAMQPSASKLKTYKNSHGQASTERTGPDVYTSKHQSAGKLKSESHRPKASTSGRTGPDIAASQHQSTGKPHSDLHRPESLSSNTDPVPSRHQSASKLAPDRPLTD